MQGQEDLDSLPNQPQVLNTSESSLTFLMLLQNTPGVDNSSNSCLSKAQNIVLLFLSKENHLSLDCAFRIMVLEMRDSDRCQHWLKRKFKKHTFMQNKGSGSQKAGNFFPHRSQRSQRKLYWKTEFLYPSVTRYMQFKKRCKVAQRLF